MIGFPIRAAASIASGWTVYWFTHGLSVVDISLAEEDLTPMFFPKARVVTIKGDKRKTSNG